MFVFPMAGLSSRFTSAGYQIPKYMLPAGNRTLFEHAISGFRDYYRTEKFLFVYLADKVDPSFIQDGCERRGLDRDNIILAPLSSPTDGQASTVAQGLRQARIDAAESITIFNIDSTYRHFVKPDFLATRNIDGYLDVFRAPGDHWSFVLPNGPVRSEGEVIEVAEKNRISELCSTGLYYFSSVGLFLDAYRENQSSTIEGLGRTERFVAPIFNHVLRRGGTVFYRLIGEADIAFSGTPEEYEQFLTMQPYNYR